MLVSSLVYSLQEPTAHIYNCQCKLMNNLIQGRCDPITLLLYFYFILFILLHVCHIQLLSIYFLTTFSPCCVNLNFPLKANISLNQTVYICILVFNSYNLARGKTTVKEIT